jgi:TetR/AcrR family transcriptional repressor of bet genes
MEHHDTRERLMDAAVDSIYRHGFANATTSRISELAAVSAATIHHHFDGKEDLLFRAMLRLTARMQSGALAGLAAAGTARGKIAAIIEAVLGSEQSDDKAAQVWLSFWVHADYHPGMRRLKNIYARRLRANLRFYCRRLFAEVAGEGADVEARAAYGASALTAMMHGAWLSYTLREDALDLPRARSLVGDYLDLLVREARRDD